MKQNTIDFFRAALIRALRTGIQSVLSKITVGVGLSDIDGKTIISVSAVAMLVSFLTSILTGLPEVNENGLFIIDDTDSDRTKWTLRYDGDPNNLKAGDSVRFKIVSTEQSEGKE